MSRDRLKYAACQACGYRDGDRSHVVASLSLGHALDAFPPALAVAMEAGEFNGERNYEKRRRKMREREEKRLREETYNRTAAAIRANPTAYGFTGIELWILGLIIGPIIKRIVAWLMGQRYETPAGDNQIQAVAGAQE